MHEGGYTYMTVKQVTDNPCYPFTAAQLRYFILHKDDNYFADCLRFIGKRIYIRKDLFEEWIESHADI